jgi:hypothetical protein
MQTLRQSSPFLKRRCGLKSHCFSGNTSGAERRKASQAFGKLHGVKTIEVHIATCRPRRAMQTWKHLESALIDTFWNRYFGLPRYNKVRPKPKDGLFRYKALAKLISQFDRA